MALHVLLYAVAALTKFLLYFDDIDFRPRVVYTCDHAFPSQFFHSQAMKGSVRVANVIWCMVKLFNRGCVCFFKWYLVH